MKWSNQLLPRVQPPQQHLHHQHHFQLLLLRLVSLSQMMTGMTCMFSYTACCIIIIIFQHMYIPFLHHTKYTLQ